MQDLLQVYRNIESKTLPKDFHLWGSFSSWDNVVQDYEMFGDQVIFDIQDDYAFVLVNDHNRITVVVLAALPGSSEQDSEGREIKTHGSEIKATLRCLAAIKKLMRDSGVRNFSCVCRKETSWPLVQAMEKKGKIKLIHHFTENIGEEVEVVAGVAIF